LPKHISSALRAYGFPYLLTEPLVSKIGTAYKRRRNALVNPRLGVCVGLITNSKEQQPNQRTMLANTFKQSERKHLISKKKARIDINHAIMIC